jgi:hypothetical protein
MCWFQVHHRLGGNRTPRGSRKGVNVLKAVDVELLVVADCPHEAEAAHVLRRALDDVGLFSMLFEVRVIRDPAEAMATGFVGSPTVLINGVDPFRERDSLPGLGCRIYRHGAEASGVPPLRPLRRALRRAIDPD